jgi:predicted DNA-binding transcriptional regulator YafY
MRASRLLSILASLDARGLVSATELASECEVSVRTIYRDIEALSAAGIPVYSERGSDGGYRMLDGYRMQLNALSPQEADALFMVGLSGPASDLGLGAVMVAAQNKILSAMPAHLRAGAEQMRARFHLDAPAWFAHAEQPEYLQAVAAAVWEQRAVRIRYQSWKGEKFREVEPLGLVMKSGSWYLAAQIDGTVRTYRISRILELTPCDYRFERPAGFDLARYWRDATDRMEADMHRNTAGIRLSPTGVKMLEMVTSPFVMEATRIEDHADANGWRRASMPIGSIRQACVELLKFGIDVEVLEPPELRAKMAEISCAMNNMYAVDSPNEQIRV